MWSNILFAAVLVIISAGLMTGHVISRRKVAKGERDERTRDFMLGQLRRRMMASASIGVAGLAILGGIWIQGPVATILYWSCVALAVVWMGFLALLDLIRARSFYGQIRKEQLAEHAALRAELERIRSRGGNGKPGDGDLPIGRENREEETPGE